MKVLVYGTGGRDHCLADSYGDSQHIDKVFFAPGTPGVKYTPKGKRGLIECMPKLRDFHAVADFCVERGVDLVDVGSENPLEKGLVDVLVERGIRAIGPISEYVQLESDRAFTKVLLRMAGVPVAAYRAFSDPEKARKYVRNIGYPVVVKANGLAAGKGALVCDDISQAEDAIAQIMVQKVFGKSGDRVLVEERKYGTEISFFVYLDGEHVLPLQYFAQDFKRAFDPDDKERIEQFGGNPNTGGLGCYCPHSLCTPSLVSRIMKEIVNPTVDTLYNKLGWNYKGVLYFGLNLDDRGDLCVFEINVRHGDPEWEVLSRKLSTDLFEIGTAVWEGTLDQIEPVWNNQYYIDVVAVEGRSKAARGWNPGYPKRYGKYHKITGLEKIGKGIAVYFSGVAENNDGELITDGGRVFHIVAGAPTLEEARKKAYRNIRKISFIDNNNNDENCMRFLRAIGGERVFYLSEINPCITWDMELFLATMADVAEGYQVDQLDEYLGIRHGKLKMDLKKVEKHLISELGLEQIQMEKKEDKCDIHFRLGDPMGRHKEAHLLDMKLK